MLDPGERKSALQRRVLAIVISGNTEAGIVIADNPNGASVKRNLIGLAAGGTTASDERNSKRGAGNTVDAVTTNLTIGRSEGGSSPSGEGNLIAFNGACRNRSTIMGAHQEFSFSENSIFSNGGLG
jgi:hypothetical protein